MRLMLLAYTENSFYKESSQIQKFNLIQSDRETCDLREPCMGMLVTCLVYFWKFPKKLYETVAY